MSLNLTATVKDNANLWLDWDHAEFAGSLSLTGQFSSTFTEPVASQPGVGTPSIDDPDSLVKLGPIPSQRILTSVTDLTVLIDGVDYAEFCVGLDVMHPLSGETQGTITLASSNMQALDPYFQPSLQAGKTAEIRAEFAGIPVPVLLGGYIVEPPQYRVRDRNVGELRLRVGDLFLLKRQSENYALEAYCGPLPQTTAQAAQIFTRIRGIPGTWGGEALLEGANPDFVDGPPWDYLQALYEVLDYDVRTTRQGTPVALPRPVWDTSRAIRLDPSKVIEGNLDSGVSKPYSVVTGYNTFERNLGMRQRSTEETDFSGWDPANTEPYFVSNNTYRVIKTNWLGDTPTQEVVETWGYLPDNSIVPDGSIPGPETGPCGEFIPAPEVQPVTTTLRVIQTQRSVVYFEPHLSGNFLIVGRETQTQGWSEFTNAQGDTQLYFGDLASSRETYAHRPVEAPRVCPQYWAILRNYTSKVSYSRIKPEGSQTEPVYQLTTRETDIWTQNNTQLVEGQVEEWTLNRTTEAYDASTGRWTGGPSPATQGTPPSAGFIRAYKVPVTLESRVELPELVRLFGVRESKPVQFSSAYTQTDLTRATDRYARETAGLAYSVHLVLDPRVALKPGDRVIYEREPGLEIHGLVWTQEVNLTGPQATQSVVLLRTFTEPSLVAARERAGYTPETQFDLGDPCS